MSDPTRARTRILLADPSEFTLIGLRQVLERDGSLEVVATVSDGDDVVPRTLELEPDVVVMEIDLPNVAGDSVTRRLRRELPRVAVLLLGMGEDEQRLFKAIRAGAAAYLRKDCEPAELIEAIKKVTDGRFLINDTIFARPSLASRVLTEFRDLAVYGPASTEIFAPLSPREVEILDNISQGRTNKEVAHALALSEQTVKNHVSSILRKLSVNDRTQAVVYALRQGWIKGLEVRSER